MQTKVMKSTVLTITLIGKEIETFQDILNEVDNSNFDLSTDGFS